MKNLSLLITALVCIGAKGQAASRVLLLSTMKDDLEKKEILGILDKNDSGDTGMINFALMKHPFIFKELI